MTSDCDIYTTANSLIEHHGNQPYVSTRRATP